MVYSIDGVKANSQTDGVASTLTCLNERYTMLLHCDMGNSTSPQLMGEFVDGKLTAGNITLGKVDKKLRVVAVEPADRTAYIGWPQQFVHTALRPIGKGTRYLVAAWEGNEFDLMSDFWRCVMLPSIQSNSPFH